jgi:hypothetical protein
MSYFGDACHGGTKSEHSAPQLITLYVGIFVYNMTPALVR